MDKFDKNIKLTFYIVCGLLLGAPFVWKIIKILPELIEMIPDLTEILSAYGYAALVVISLVIAYKLKEKMWLKIVSIYAIVGLVLGAATLIFDSFGLGKIVTILFSIICAPFIGVDSGFAIISVMIILAFVSYLLMNKLPDSDNNQQGAANQNTVQNANPNSVQNNSQNNVK